MTCILNQICTPHPLLLVEGQDAHERTNLTGPVWARGGTVLRPCSCTVHGFMCSLDAMRTALPWKLLI